MSKKLISITITIITIISSLSAITANAESNTFETTNHSIQSAFKFSKSILNALPQVKTIPIKVTKCTDSKITVKWESDSNIKNYDVFIDKGNGMEKIGSTTKSHYTFSGLTPDTSYNMYISSEDSKENTYYKSKVVSQKTKMAEIKVVLEQTDAGIQINWDKENENSLYVISKDDTVIGITGATSFLCEDTNEAEYKVSPFNINNAGVTSVVQYTAADLVFKSPVVTSNSVVLSWSCNNSSDLKYEVFDNSDGHSLGVTEDTSMTVINLSPNTEYSFTVKPFSDTVVYQPTDISVTTSENHLYWISGASVSNGYYTGSPDGDSININYANQIISVDKSKAKIQNNAVTLPTGTISQIYGRIKGYSACGIANIVELVNSEKGMNWDKDDLIEFCEKNNIYDRTLRGSNGGIRPSYVKTIIEKYSNNEFSVENKFNESVNPSETIKDELDKGHRVLTMQTYNGTMISTANSCSHFVLFVGYEYIDGELYLYYTDSYFNGSYGRGLSRVSGSTVNTIMLSLIWECPSERMLLVLN